MAFPFFTCGGMFYWMDRYDYAGWRIQESMWTRRCRLLDPFNIKRSVGSFEECHKKLLYFLRAWECEAPVKKAAVIIHGLFQRPASFEKMAGALKENFEPVVFSYPMLRFSLMKSAKVLNTMLDARPDIEQFNFVAYGSGGLILRQAAALKPAWSEKTGRTVFIAVPQQGYSQFEKWKDKGLYKSLLGAAGTNILPETAQALPAMPGECGSIIAGKDNGKGVLPFLKEDNDGILKVKDARYDGMKEEYMAVDKNHFFLHRDEKLIEMTQSFLSTGKFGRRVRIRKEQSYTNLWDK